MALLNMARHRNDWFAYLVAADQCEEAGDYAKSAMLRRQGEVMQAIVSVVEPAAKRFDPRTMRRSHLIRGRLPDGGAFQASIAPRQVTLWIAPYGLAGFTQYNLVRSLICARPSYLPKRIRECFGSLRY